MPHLPHHLLYCPKGQPSQGPWNNGYPLPPTTRECSYIYPAEHSSRGIPLNRNLPCRLLLPPLQWHLGPHLSPRGHNLPDWVEPPSPSETISKVTPAEPPHSKQKEEMLLHKALSRSHQEAFSRDSKLVQRVREDYY